MFSFALHFVECCLVVLGLAEEGEGHGLGPLREARATEPLGLAQRRGLTLLVLLEDLEHLLHVLGRDVVALIGDDDLDVLVGPSPLPLSPLLDDVVLESGLELGAEEHGDAHEEVRASAEDAVDLHRGKERPLNPLTAGTESLPVKPVLHAKGGVEDVARNVLELSPLLRGHLLEGRLLRKKGLVVGDREVVVEDALTRLLELAEVALAVAREEALEVVEEVVCVGLHALLLLLLVPLVSLPEEDGVRAEVPKGRGRDDAVDDLVLLVGEGLGTKVREGHFACSSREC